MEKITVTKSWGSYNARRYGRPWAARITAFNGAPTLEFIAGAYNGNDDGGEIVVTGEIGEVVKIGQKDYRGNNTDNDFYVIANSDGAGPKLKYIESPIEARKLWQAWQAERANSPKS